jgi:hypothetical protein
MGDDGPATSPQSGDRVFERPLGGGAAAGAGRQAGGEKGGPHLAGAEDRRVPGDGGVGPLEQQHRRPRLAGVVGLDGGERCLSGPREERPTPAHGQGAGPELDRLEGGRAGRCEGDVEGLEPVLSGEVAREQVDREERGGRGAQLVGVRFDDGAVDAVVQRGDSPVGADDDTLALGRRGARPPWVAGQRAPGRGEQELARGRKVLVPAPDLGAGVEPPFRRSRPGRDDGHFGGRARLRRDHSDPRDDRARGTASRHAAPSNSRETLLPPKA